MSQHSILLIDPFRNLLNAYRMILEAEQYRVETANHVEEALSLLSTRQVSIILTEYFPVLDDTYRMIRQVKERWPMTCIIMVTNTIVDDLTYEKLFGGGLDDIILKPYSPAKILVHIRKGLWMREVLLKNGEPQRLSHPGAMEQHSGEKEAEPVFFRKSLRKEVKRARRHQHPLSLLMFEIPEKEQIGDRLDAFYTGMTDFLRRHTREEDVVGRGNGHLGILLPETNQVGSQALIKRLSTLVSAHPPFGSDSVLKSLVPVLSIQSFTFPDQFAIPASLQAVVDEVQREYPRN